MRVLRIAKNIRRVFVVSADRYDRQGGTSFAKFVKHGRIYHPDFDCHYWLDQNSWWYKFPPEYEETLEELVEQGYNLKLAGYPGDGKKAYWNNHSYNSINLICQMRLLERW